jgi:hypothetical protein
MSKRISTSLLTLLAFPGAASAADLPSLKAPPAPPPPIFSWEGVYIGTHVGYGLNKYGFGTGDRSRSWLLRPWKFRWRLAELFGARPADRLSDRVQ